MNKQALKLKKQRRALKEKEKQEKMNKLWNEMTQYSDNSGLPKLKKTKEQMLKIYNATKYVDNKVITKTGVVSLISSLIALKEEFAYDSTSLIRFATRLKSFIISFTSCNRPISKIIEEIELDYNVDIRHRCSELPKLTMNDFNKYDMEDTIIKSTVDNIPYFLAINAYTFMNDLTYSVKGKCWNHADLESFVNKAFNIYTNILNDTSKLKSYNDKLKNDDKLDVNLDTGALREIL